MADTFVKIIEISVAVIVSIIAGTVAAAVLDSLYLIVADSVILIALLGAIIQILDIRDLGEMLMRVVSALFGKGR